MNLLWTQNFDCFKLELEVVRINETHYKPYKIRLILRSLISPLQAAYVPQRQITDNICIAKEAVDIIKKKKRKKKSIAGIKIDLSKAFDRIE